MRAKYAVLALAMALLLGLPFSAWGAVKYEVLHNFGSGKDGSGPSGPLVPDSSGGLYGVTGTGGTGQCSDYGCGTVFKLTPQANGRWKEAVLHSFTAGSDGAIPWGVMVLDQSGHLYGSLLGDNGLGGSGVFWLRSKPGGWSNQLIYTDGAGPGLLVDEPGNLYGEKR